MFSNSVVSILSAFKLNATCGAAKFFADKLPCTVVLPNVAAKLSKATEFCEKFALAEAIDSGFFNSGVFRTKFDTFAVPA